MSAICEACPFVRGCDVCAFQGAEMPEPQANPGANEPVETPENGKVGVAKTAPEDAPTSTPGPRPTEAAKPHGRTCIT